MEQELLAAQIASQISDIDAFIKRQALQVLTAAQRVTQMQARLASMQAKLAEVQSQPSDT